MSDDQAVPENEAAVIAAGEVLGLAETDFLTASVAVWREIDRLDSRPEGYHPTDMDIKLRKRERAAWIRYRYLLDGDTDADA